MACLAGWTAPGRVRAVIGFRLGEWGLAAIAGDVCLVASELVTNAVEAAPDGRIQVRLTREPEAVFLGVWDSVDVLPVARRVFEPCRVTADSQALDPGHDDGLGGWGLPIVRALSAQCGVERTRPCGKWVWSRISSGVLRDGVPR
ncbi:ATP-binding protein [Actinomadura sp. NBRC 104412]|uniref:ATP-binding protein n=1 Tax=Actinomadura sp. NBRC 104412 TaxID=3032203 RepID=UPI002554DA71|nr:ATP-binding protein [Actinomadura sp. NBRC 104412]